MKKYLILLMIFLVGCNLKKDTITYSNISNEKDLEYVSDVLNSAGISDTQINSFKNQVKTFYDTVGTKGMVEGFKPFSKIKYDPYELQEKWESANSYIGYNCRITSFTLFNELFSGSGFNEDELDYLIFDYQTLEHDKFSTDEVNKFNTLFQSIDTEKTLDEDFHKNKILENFKTYNIQFNDSKVKLVSVYIHDDSIIKENKNLLFIGHTGVLVELEDGYLLIEKLAFQEPYQAVKFQSLSQVKNYFLEKYDTSESDGTSKPIITLNDTFL